MGGHKIHPVAKSIWGHQYIYTKNWKMQGMFLLVGSFMLAFQFNRYHQMNQFRTKEYGQYINYSRIEAPKRLIL